MISVHSGRTIDFVLYLLVNCIERAVRTFAVAKEENPFSGICSWLQPNGDRVNVDTTHAKYEHTLLFIHYMQPD